MRDLVRLVFQPLDGVDDGAPLRRGRGDEVLQQARGLDVQLGDGGEELEELFIARKETHR